MKLSVIIPVYNAAGEIEETVRSVLDACGETEPEIVLVDDGSTDDTPSVLRRLAEENERLVILTQKNAGPAAARDRGIAAAAGDWIVFCDSDDRFPAGAIDRIASFCEGEEDLILFGYFLVNGEEKTAYHAPDGVLQTPDDWRARFAELYGKNLLNQVWAKAFRKKLLIQNEIRFPDLLWGEDRLFLFAAMEKAASIRVARDCVYEYVQRPGSLISRFLPEKPEACLTIAQKTRDMALSHGALTRDAEAVLSYMYQKSLLSCLVNLYAPSCPLSRREKRSFAEKVLAMADPFPGAATPPDCGRSFRFLLGVKKTGLVGLNLLCARAVFFASRALPRLFFSAKHALNTKNKGES